MGCISEMYQDEKWDTSPTWTCPTYTQKDRMVSPLRHPFVTLWGNVTHCDRLAIRGHIAYAYSFKSVHHGRSSIFVRRNLSLQKSSMQEPSMRIVPPVAPKSASLTAKANTLGLHDTLQYGPRSIAAETKSRGGLENRLARVSSCTSSSFYLLNARTLQWEETQDNLRLTMMRDLYGVHAPARLLMERKIVASVCIRSLLYLYTRCLIRVPRTRISLAWDRATFISTS
jgi:hypothetical protein